MAKVDNDSDEIGNGISKIFYFSEIIIQKLELLPILVILSGKC
ncbi:MAG: hypothetical protein ACJA02_000117 [Myxococcota bacterium]|jgi:hypothetical protein